MFGSCLHHQMEGAPSLRILQGWVEMRPTQFLSEADKPIAHALVVPTLLQTTRKDGAPTVFIVGEKSKAGPPAREVFL